MVLTSAILLLGSGSLGGLLQWAQMHSPARLTSWGSGVLLPDLPRASRTVLVG